MDNEATAAKKRITLREVSERAGVSIATISKVLNGRDDVSEATRSRVEASLYELGYTPVGRGVIPPQPSIVAAFGQLGRAYDGEVLSGIIDSAEDEGCRVSVTRANFGDDAGAWLRTWKSIGASGAVLITTPAPGSMERAAIALGFPVVVVDPQYRPSQFIPVIGANNWSGATQATEHLLDLGHTEIAFAGWDKRLDFCNERFGAFRSRIETAGFTLRPQFAGEGTISYESGYELGLRYARSAFVPTGIFAVCDVAALGVIEGIRAAGLRVPDDISVIGFDDVKPAAWASPPLTTVRQPLSDMGALAARTVLEMARGNRPASEHIQLATKLVVRGSTAPPRQGLPR